MGLRDVVRCVCRNRFLVPSTIMPLRLAIFFLVPQVAPAIAQVMELSDKFDVSARGAASYSIAIDVPPGTAALNGLTTTRWQHHQTVTDTSANGTLENQAVTTTSANGLSVTTEYDTTGNGTFDDTRRVGGRAAGNADHPSPARHRDHPNLPKRTAT
jgi:hypothetical protein